MDILYFLSQIDRLRMEHKMTKATFYEKAGITASAVSQWRHQITVPSENTIQRIANLFEVDVSFLTGNQKNPASETETGKVPTIQDWEDFIATFSKDELKAVIDMATTELLRRD